MSVETLVGIDVGSKELVVALKQGKTSSLLHFSNDSDGHGKLCRVLTKRGRSARVCLEATGIYSFDISLALHRHPRIEVMVANPRATASFAKAMMKRSKTDAVDAQTLLTFVERMPFSAWNPPTQEVMALRAIARQLSGVTEQLTAAKNRLHVARKNSMLPVFLLEDLETEVSALKERIVWLERRALAFIKEHPSLSEKHALIVSIPGIANRSAVYLLGELLMLPAGMDVRQWVAHAGLDPRVHSSGTSVNKSPRISRTGNIRIRRALFMPALVAIQRDEAVRGFYDRLVNRGKPKMKANVAVMRKLLHAIYGVFKSGTQFQASKCFPTPINTTNT